MRGMRDRPNQPPTTDWFARPLSAFVLWCVPLIFGFGTSFLGAPPMIRALVWTAAFLWMGAGCVVNAVRCHRLHCYISGPVFLLGAATEGLLAANLLSFGSHAIDNTAGITLAVALLSFVPERIWAKYA